MSLTDGTNGDTLRSWQLKGEPLEVAAAQAGRGDGGGASCSSGVAFSVTTNRQVLYLLHHATRPASGAGAGAAVQAAAVQGAGEAPLELSFQEHYGPIRRHLWFGAGLIMVGFRGGRVVVVSPARCGG